MRTGKRWRVQEVWTCINEIRRITATIESIFQSLPPIPQTLMDNSTSLSNDSTQSSNVVCETEFSDVGVETASASKKRGRGPAKSTKFDNLQKIGPIPLLIKDKDCKVSCENATMFSGRVTNIYSQASS
ncbi:hypothetical protein F2P56_007067 [Juglans regia]|uniref:Uncharacterized protein n=1 Tax=Juglans regia TaxID=51240 RepID=A0A833Y1B7_JUGRE|nr:hypothetical protein F2P56_007067 [Juglans regia]